MRLFFALRPPEAIATRLAALAEALAAEARGKPVPQAKIHMTLAFLGDVDADRVEAAAEAAASVPRGALEVVVDRVGSFRSARVAWAGCRETPPGLATLQGELAEKLRRAGFTLEERAFTPHLTLVRKIAAPVRAAPVEPVRWHAGELALMRSELGTGSYSTLRSWPFE